MAQHHLRLYQAVEAERKNPGSLYRWAKWLSLPVRPEMKPEKVLSILWVCGYVWSDEDWPQDGPRMTVDEFMEPE